MGSSRITQKIQYNLYDRGRCATGQDRSNVNVKAMIAKFNSPEVQEHVRAGTLNGYCGHQVRQRYGMTPPETVIIDGRQILIEPAIRTVFLHAADDGTVTHQQEFFENPTGEHVYRQYKAKVGGFSTALNYLVNGSELLPNVMGGFDYVFAPNFAANASLGLFDSANDPQVDNLIQSMLEHEIVAMYDGISEISQTYDYMAAMSEQVRELRQQLESENKRKLSRTKQQQAVDLDIYDSSLCANVIPFDQAFQEAEAFLSAKPANAEDDKPAPQGRAEDKFLSGLSKIILGG